MNTLHPRLADDLVAARRRDLTNAADHHRLVKLAPSCTRPRRLLVAVAWQGLGSVLIRIGEQMHMHGARRPAPSSDSPSGAHGTPAA